MSTTDWRVAATEELAALLKIVDSPRACLQAGVDREKAALRADELSIMLGFSTAALEDAARVFTITPQSSLPPRRLAP